LPLAQQLEVGERVLWSAKPITTWTRFIPGTNRDIAETLLGLFTVLLMARTLHSAIPAMKRVLDAGVSATSVGFICLVISIGLTCLLLCTVAGALVWAGVVKPAMLQINTHYLITNQRVLISQGNQELHLERSRIVDIIQAPLSDGRSNLFLVLDGPRARAVALSGAFEQRVSWELTPVLRHVVDADSVGKILQLSRKTSVSRAA
jgi:hypothetical protein